MSSVLNKIEVIYQKAYDFIMFLCKLLLVAEIAITSVAVLGRYVPAIPDPAWSEEIVLTCMIYMGMLSASLAIHRCAHIHMTTLDKWLPDIVIKVLDVFDDLVVLAFGVVMLFVGLPYALTVGQNSMYTSITWLSKFWLYLPIALSGLTAIFFQLGVLLKHILRFKKSGGEK